MRARFPHRRAAVPARSADELADESNPFVLADRACCCPARPVVRVVMPPAPARPHPVDLLLCGHHYRVSAAALTAAGAVAFDGTGAIVETGVSDHETTRAGRASTAPRR
jgi:hypothetical protein